MSETNVNVPHELYSEAMLTEAEKKVKSRLVVIGIVSAFLLVVFVWTMIVRGSWRDLRDTYPLSETAMQVISSASIVLLGIFALFWLDLFVLPAVRYRNLIRTALTGRTHVETMTFSRMDPDPCMADGLPCRSFIFLGEPDRHGSRERLFYMDQTLPLPEFEEGRDYLLKYSGRMIIGLYPMVLQAPAGDDSPVTAGPA